MTTQTVAYPRTEEAIPYVSYPVFFITVLKKVMPDTPHLIKTRRETSISCTASRESQESEGKWFCSMHLTGLPSVHI